MGYKITISMEMISCSFVPTKLHFIGSWFSYTQLWGIHVWQLGLVQLALHDTFRITGRTSLPDATNIKTQNRINQKDKGLMTYMNSPMS